MFSDYLTVPLEEPKAASQKVISILQASNSGTTFSIDRAKPAGGYAKKTSTLLKLDVDLVLMINGLDGYAKNPERFETAYKKIQEKWKRELIKQTNLKKEDFEVKRLALSFQYEGIDFDLLPAPNFCSNDPDQQVKLALEAMRKQKNPILYSSAVVERTVEFVRRQSPGVHTLCRLVKFWQQSVGYYSSFNGRSHLFDCIAIYAGNQVEEDQVFNVGEMYTTGYFLIDALQTFFLTVIYLEKQRIDFPDFFDDLDSKPWFLGCFPSMKKKGVYAPENPYNNLLEKADKQFYDSFKKAAKKSLECLQNLLDNDMALHLPSIFAPLHKADDVMGAFSGFQLAIGIFPWAEIAPTVKFKGTVSSTLRKQLEQLTKVLGSIAIMAAHSKASGGNAKHAAYIIQDFILKVTGKKPPVQEDKRRYKQENQVTMRFPVKESPQSIMLSFNVNNKSCVIL